MNHCPLKTRPIPFVESNDKLPHIAFFRRTVSPNIHLSSIKRRLQIVPLFLFPVAHPLYPVQVFSSDFKTCPPF